MRENGWSACCLHPPRLNSDGDAAESHPSDLTAESCQHLSSHQHCGFLHSCAQNGTILKIAAVPAVATAAVTAAAATDVIDSHGQNDHVNNKKVGKVTIETAAADCGVSYWSAATLQNESKLH